LQRKIKNISENCSEYRLDLPMNTYYVITDDDVVEKLTFGYDSKLDVKKDKINPFVSVDLSLESSVERSVE